MPLFPIPDRTSSKTKSKGKLLLTQPEPFSDCSDIDFTWNVNLRYLSICGLPPSVGNRLSHPLENLVSHFHSSLTGKLTNELS